MHATLTVRTMQASLHSSTGTVLSEVSNQSEAPKSQRQLSPGKQNRHPARDLLQPDVDMTVEGISALRMPHASRSRK